MRFSWKPVSRTTLAGLALALLVACSPHPRHARYEVVYVDRAPPTSRVEVITTRPGAEFVWVPGYWRWDRNAYLWVGGNWERAPHARAVWIQGRWRHSNRGWYWAPGHWR
jgi:YXWGXW repeat-containing protein